MIQVYAKHERRKEAQLFNLTGKRYTTQKEVREDFERTHPRFKVSKIVATANEFDAAQEKEDVIADHTPPDYVHPAPINNVKE